MIPLSRLLPLLLLTCATGALPPEERFSDPPPDTRILRIIHGWPDAPEAQETRIAQLKRQGFGGAVCNVAFDGYLEDETKWQSFLRAVGRLRAEGMALWLYDEKGYPSGTAGGIVLRDHPEWAARGILVADAQVADGKPLRLAKPPGALLLAKAFPVRDGQLDLAAGRDLAPHIAGDALEWTPPPGRWHAMLLTHDAIFEGTHAALNVFAKQPYSNLLLPEPTARFLEVTHDAYARRLGPDLGAIFQSTFTDEPSLMSAFLRPMPWRVLPWSQSLASEFERRRARPFPPVLPCLVAPAGPDGALARHDFWLTIAELVSENFFGQIQRRCATYKIPSGGHLLAEESVASHVPFYGDFFRCLRRLDAPGIDCLTSLPEQVPWHIARLARSAADLDGGTTVMCEVSDHAQRYRPQGDSRPRREVTEHEIRGTLNRLFLGGINSITSYYSFSGLDDVALRRLNAWTGRCCALLRNSRPSTGIALLYPVESLWVHSFASSHSAKDSPGALAIQEMFQGINRALFSELREFVVLDSRTLAEAKTDAGAIGFRDLAPRILILPRTDTLASAAASGLCRFVRSGGLAIAVGALPRTVVPPDPSIGQSLAALFPSDTRAATIQPAEKGGGGTIFLPSGSEDLLGPILDGLLPPDASSPERASPCRITRRRLGSRELFLVINDSPNPWTGSLAFHASGAATTLDPASGQRAAIPRADPPGPGPRTIPLSLDGFGARFVTFDSAPTPRPFSLAPGRLPGLKMVELPPAATPKAGTGKNTIDVSVARADNGRWSARGTLKEADTDSWCFLRFPYPEKIDLTDAFGIAVDCALPEGQNASARLFVYLHEKNGDDFIADLGRVANDPGSRTHHVAISRFQPSRNARDANNRLDLDQITAISVGWGGYHGPANEGIEFSVTPPRLTRRIHLTTR